MKELITIGNDQKRMSSLQIAELTGKDHRNVMRDMRNLIDQGAITQLNFELSEYRDSSGKSNPMYMLDFKASVVLVTGYDAVKRAAVIDRWLSLETGESQPVFITAAKKPTTVSAKYREAAGIIRANMQISKLLGTDIPMAKAIAVEDAHRETGIDFKKLLPLADIKEVPVGIRQIAKTAEIKERLAASALIESGVAARDDKGSLIITDLGRQLHAGSMEPFKSKNSEHTGYACKWFPSVVIPLIQSSS